MPVFFLPTWFLVMAVLLLVLYAPFWMIREMVTSARERAQAAAFARERQADLAREVERLELLEEHRTLLSDISKRKDAIERPARPIYKMTGLDWYGKHLRDQSEYDRKVSEYDRKVSEIKRPERLCWHADRLLYAVGLGTGTSLHLDAFQCVMTRTASRAMCDRNLRLIRMSPEAYADKTDQDFEADVLALIGQLNNEFIVKLVRGGWEGLEVVRTIKSKPAIYSLGVDQRTVLKGTGVSDRIIAAMTATSALAENDPSLWRSGPSGD